ncbi:nucleoside recognition domain-containing protein [Bacillus sp. FJAT-27986]|uniref:nucleoside recognition domain-containing protein n=1 Tax=Bacillus sp. FJAT-27986 TaxID=1743146 RepID=UPI00080AC674|nr:nucleoside recognition domain-containing protein [Bacillus sp. FJAT-27986]OCA84715.1 hypothetical protein A8L44_10000 [Bacillus sp. FJAT-27986]
MKKDTISKGIMAGLRTTWMLGKIIFPVTFLISILQYTPVLPWVIDLISPAMGLIGLPGDAAIPLVLGNFLNLYAGIGGILALDSLTVKEVFIIAVMLSFSHNLFIETGVALKVGVKLWVVLLTRIGLALLSAIVIHLVWQGGSERIYYGISGNEEVVSGFMPVLLLALEKAAYGTLKLALIVIPLMLVIQIMKDLNWLNKFSDWMKPITRMLGMKENTSMTLVAGLVIGLAYGAGVMLDAVREDGVSKKDITIAFIFLIACHAVVEDTVIFIPLGVPVLPLLLIRLVTAILLAVTIAFIWKKVELRKRKDEQREAENHNITI